MCLHLCSRSGIEGKDTAEVQYNAYKASTQNPTDFRLPLPNRLTYEQAAIVQDDDNSMFDRFYIKTACNYGALRRRGRAAGRKS